MQLTVITDSCSDLPLSYVKENKIDVLPIMVNIQGREVPDDLGESMSHKEFYEIVRNGEMPSTSLINVQSFVDVFKKKTEDGYAVLYLGFSSPLSGTLNSALIARDIVTDEMKNADITVIDTKCASLGQGLIVYYVNEMLKNGATKDEIVKWVQDNNLKVNHWITVDDLGHLKRGGRLSGASAVIGSLLNIKPILQITDEGKLVPSDKVKGRKKSIKYLVDNLKDKIVDSEEQIIFISHGDCLEDVEKLTDAIQKEVKVKGFFVNTIGPGVGSHVGPGTLAVFYIGKSR
ncbi:MAG: fatty acid-binding protein DegV [Bacillales bacterium]|jgi:DegV family protein with EDD domain|nr:fatty acid-binding protein DegV [Bacillales bacterium]